VTPAPHLKNIVDALMAVSPWAITARFETFDHCIEVAVAAVAALRHWNIKAEVIPVGLVLLAKEDDRGVYVGITPEDVYGRIAPENRPPFEEWVKTNCPDAPAESHHAVVKAKCGGSVAIIDLTLGQLRMVFPELPFGFVSYGDYLPEVESTSWHGAYLPPSRPEIGRSLAKKCQVKGLGEDLRDLMRLYLHAGNLDRFLAALQGQQPEMVRTCLVRMEMSRR